MDIRLDKVATRTPRPPDAAPEIENLKREEQRSIQKREAVKEDQKKQEQKPVSETPKFVMSELDMKELLLIMGSRGPSKTVEELVRMTKKYRDQLKQR